MKHSTKITRTTNETKQSNNSMSNIHKHNHGNNRSINNTNIIIRSSITNNNVISEDASSNQLPKSKQCSTKRPFSGASAAIDDDDRSNNNSSKRIKHSLKHSLESPPRQEMVTENEPFHSRTPVKVVSTKVAAPLSEVNVEKDIIERGASPPQVATTPMESCEMDPSSTSTFEVLPVESQPNLK
jgi:hypothetical protein